MDIKRAKILWWTILAIESVMLIAMLLGDFGILNAKFKPLSYNSIVYHAVDIALIVVSALNLRKLRGK